jgi:hypothetical protein
MVCEFRAIVRLPFRRGKYIISIKTVTKKSPQPTFAPEGYLKNTLFPASLISICLAISPLPCSGCCVVAGSRASDKMVSLGLCKLFGRVWQLGFEIIEIVRV